MVRGTSRGDDIGWGTYSLIWCSAVCVACRTSLGISTIYHFLLSSENFRDFRWTNMHLTCNLLLCLSTLGKSLLGDYLQRQPKVNWAHDYKPYCVEGYFRLNPAWFLNSCKVMSCTTCFRFLLLETHFNLVLFITEGLQEYFKTFGEVTDCIVMVDGVSKRSRYWHCEISVPLYILLYSFFEKSCPTKPYATMPKAIVGNGAHGPWLRLLGVSAT